MKKVISTWMLALVLVTGAFVSCSKDGDKPTPPPGGGGTGGENPPPTTSTYFMKMKIDGVQKSFPVTAAVIQEAEGGKILIIDGANENQTEINELIVGAAGTVAAGEYVEGDHDTYGITGIYKPENVDQDHSFWAGVVPNGASPFKIIITSITADVVKGTFSGSYYDDVEDTNGDNDPGNKKVISEGQFSVKINH